MPDFSMYGYAQSGARLAEQDTVSNFMKLAEGQHQQALAQQEQAKTKQMLAEQQFYQNLGTPDGKGPASGGSLSDIAAWTAEQALARGQGALGMALAAKATKMKSDEMTAKEKAAKTQLDQVDASVKVASRVGATLGNAKSPAEWQAAQMQLAQEFPGRPEVQGYLTAQYSPELADLIRRESIKATDQAKLEQTKIRTNAYTAGVASAIDFRNFRKGILDRMADDREERTADQIKNGGRTGRNTPVGSPSKGDVDQATLMAAKLYPNLPPAEAAALGEAAASRAKALVKEVKGLDMAKATQQAITEVAQAGDIITANKMFGRIEQHYQGGGHSAETAIPATKDTNFRTNRWYVTPKGTLKYLGNGKWRTSDAPKAAALASGDEGGDSPNLGDE